MATAKNPTRSMNAYKGYCQKKAKEVDDFLHAKADQEFSTWDIQKLEELNVSLKNQFERMETAWETMMDNIEDNGTFEALEEVLNNVSEDVKKTLTASEKAISDNAAPTQSGTSGATPQPVSGAVKIEDTLKPRELLSADMNLEEANLWFDAYRAHIGFNRNNMAKLDIKVRRAMLNACLDPKMASSLRTNSKIEAETEIDTPDTGCLDVLREIFLEKNPLW